MSDDAEYREDMVSDKGTSCREHVGCHENTGCGLVHVYCGDGKGKTTAAVGLAVRAAGCGLRVCFVQFMKAGDSPELTLLENLGVKIVSVAQDKFSFQMDRDETGQAQAGNDAVLDRIIEEPCDVLVLDEIVNACRTGLASTETLLRLVDCKPPDRELVLTGRGPSQELLDRADYVTEMVSRKHPYDKGIMARKGIEF